ncbi:MAG: acyl carrier protein [Oscillospiraceae bacterium]|jgi:acyl carrier protein|nr:acyl carrier protein [Oscillospiraceae bacterium]MBQ6929275.1 acyl carrier protein [Oscillospiraceae bacterium]MBR2028768.1 acyl carrier protein [Oscillospiraceae bacterium]
MVFEKLREIISEQLEISEELITMESNLMEDFDADSLDLVDLVMSVEDEFGVEVPEEAVENLKTVGDVVKFIEENK